MLFKGGGACWLLFLVGVVDERDRDSNDKPKRLGLLLLLVLLLVVVVDGWGRDANKNPPLLELLMMQTPVLLANARSICPKPPVAYVVHGHRCERVRVMLDKMGGRIETYTKRIRASIIARAE